MIRATELRIGNLLRTLVVGFPAPGPHYEIKKVSRIFTSWFVMEDFEGLVDPMPWEPIPLTEEWLERMGFEKAEDAPGDNWWEINIGAFTLQVAVLSHIVFCHITDFDSGVLFRKFIGFRHVHQIQNLYFALTGEELSIKKPA